MTVLPRDPSRSPASQERSMCLAAVARQLPLDSRRRRTDTESRDTALHLRPRPEPRVQPASKRQSESAEAERTEPKTRQGPLHASAELSPEAAESLVPSIGESKYSGSLRPSFRVFKAADNQ